MTTESRPLGPDSVRRRPGGREGLGDLLEQRRRRGNDVDDTCQLFLPAGDLAGVDPPVHTRLRGALRMAFSPSALRTRFEPIVRRKSIQLIDGLRGRAARGLRPRPGTAPARHHDVLVVRVPGERPSGAARLVRRDARARPGRARPARSRDRRPRPHAGVHAGRRGRPPASAARGPDVLPGRRRRTRARSAPTSSSAAAMLLFVAGITTTSGLISNSLLHLDRFPDQRDGSATTRRSFRRRSRSCSASTPRSRPSRGPRPATSRSTTA